ncbi:phosphotransferase [Streptomyces coelicoflavus]|uniref:Phosphotransferase n=1 Tax=Streptomyces coelicoflavus TaxID=285562 RepID=A0A7K3PI52_9ACTN|nr:phosphotransferase [Streptomyces coelicoflavus]NEB08555.1 phosphotransferase [Streptomyces coelicoflavus]
MLTGRLIGTGRTADVYEAGAGWVLRRDREVVGDAAAEGAVMEHVRAHGYPVPRVRPAGPVTPETDPRRDLVMERLAGPTMLRACLEGALTPEEAGGTLARLLRLLHRVPAYRSADPGVRVLHLDLHPDNVILTADGPRVIDWSTAEEGDPGLDWGMSAVILAQVAAGGGPMGDPAGAMLGALLADPSGLTPGGLAEALRRRAANPTMSRDEVAALPAAEALIRLRLG